MDDNLGHELLLLMLNLSRMNDRERIVRLFVEALSAVTPGVTVRRLAAGEQSAGEIVEVATPDAHFGRVAVEDPERALSAGARARYRNAVRMLAVVLENLSRAERLATENARLDAAVAARTAELTRALGESQDLYHNAPCGYHSLDASGVFVRVNDTEIRWLGYGREELVGRKAFADLVAPESRDVFARYFEALKRSGGVQEVEIELMRRTGEVLPVLLSGTSIVDRDGHFVMSRATIFDISERRRAEKALRESEERYHQSQKLEALGRLAGGIAHDFNNLLTAILGSAEILIDGLLPEDPRREDAVTIQDAGKRAAALTRQLLAFGRRHPTMPVSIDLGEIVAGMEKMLRRLIGEDVEVVVSRGAALWRIRADPGQMEQVVLNLAVNARDAMPKGGLLRIETYNVGAGRAGGASPQVALAVTDSGVGMPSEVRERLFEPFFTTKPQGKGTGLGLATVYGIVTGAGGSIRVDSTPGQGTRFEVFLPAVEVAVEAAGAAPKKKEAPERGTDTVLIVDDDAGVRLVAARLLRKAGYTVIDAENGERALEVAAKAERLDVLVTDVVMPRMGGVQLAARLREDRPDLKVVFMSGYSDEARLADALVGGAVLLEKPFNAATLTRAIRQQLDDRIGASPEVSGAVD